MRKIRTKDEFQEALDNEYSWRVTEIRNIHTAVQTSDDSSTNQSAKKSMHRFAVPAFYAHLEGFVKESSAIYLKYACYKSKPTVDLKPHFLAFYIEDIFRSDKSKPDIFSDLCKFVKIFKDNNSITLALSKSIKNKGNLNYDCLEMILFRVGIDCHDFLTKKNFIDEVLIKIRNQIAHGEFYVVKHEEYKEIKEGVEEIMHLFKAKLESIVSA